MNLFTFNCNMIVCFFTAPKLNLFGKISFQIKLLLDSLPCRGTSVHKAVVSHLLNKMFKTRRSLLIYKSSERNFIVQVVLKT